METKELEQIKEIKKLLWDKKKEGRVCINTIEGVLSYPLKEFVKQPVDGILYDLNRDEATCMAFIHKDISWLNNFACAMVIKELKEQIDKYKEKYGELE